jgi:putative flippase GtrA
MMTFWVKGFRRSSALFEFTYARFIAVGAAAALGYFIICYALQRVSRWPPFGASVVAYVIMFGFAYFGQRNITFRSARRHRESLPAYLLLQIGCALLAAGIVQLLAMTFRQSPLVASGIATVLAGGTSYLVSASWIFFDHGLSAGSVEKGSRRDQECSPRSQQTLHVKPNKENILSSHASGD